MQKSKKKTQKATKKSSKQTVCEPASELQEEATRYASLLTLKVWQNDLAGQKTMKWS